MSEPVKRHQMVFTPSGVRFIHDDKLTALLAPLGDAKVRRASQVEQFADLSPAAQKLVLEQAQGNPLPPLDWYVDLTISGGPVRGGFATRQEALDWEVKWLQEHGIPVAE